MKQMVIRLPARFFDSCTRFKGIAEDYEIVAVFNYSSTCYTEVCKVLLHEGRSIGEVRQDKDGDLTILKNEGSEYTVLMKGPMTGELSAILADHDLKVKTPSPSTKRRAGSASSASPATCRRSSGKRTRRRRTLRSYRFTNTIPI